MKEVNQHQHKKNSICDHLIARLDPSVDDIARFPEVRPQRHALSYALKQLVSHEIDLQRMRREEPQPQSQPQRPRPKPAAVAKESRDKAESSAVASQQPAGEQQTEGEGGSATPRHLQRLQVCLALRSLHCFINSV